MGLPVPELPGIQVVSGLGLLRMKLDRHCASHSFFLSYCIGGGHAWRWEAAAAFFLLARCGCGFSHSHFTDEVTEALGAQGTYLRSLGKSCVLSVLLRAGTYQPFRCSDVLVGPEGPPGLGLGRAEGVRRVRFWATHCSSAPRPLRVCRACREPVVRAFGGAVLG